MTEQEHPSLKLPEESVETAPFQTVEVEQVDLSKIKEKTKHITEALNQLIADTEAELDAIEQRVLELVAKRLEKTQ